MIVSFQIKKFLKLFMSFTIMQKSKASKEKINRYFSVVTLTEILSKYCY